MLIEFSPQRRLDQSLCLSVAGDVLTINGAPLDLSQVLDGCSLPQGAIESDLIAGVVSRAGGVLRVPVVLPHGASPTNEQLFPAPVSVTSGAVAAPGHEGYTPKPSSPIAVDFGRMLVPKTQHELDFVRYIKRAEAKDRLIAEMAADNIGRVRSGQWTVSDLTSLAADSSVKTVLDFIGSLSFELAAQALLASSNPLLTPDIKAAWVAKLQANFYLSP